MAIILLITTNDEKTIELPILGKCILGRSSSCDLTLDDKQMSSKHGLFEINSAGAVLFTDLGSTNGSFLNNNTIHKTQFKINDKLRLGNTIIVIDEKRLSSKERLSVGRSSTGSDDLTVALPAHKGTKSLVRNSHIEVETKSAKKEKTNNKKSVVLSQELKKKVVKSSRVGNDKEKLIEQEESSGETKFLKLDILKKGK